MREASHDEGYSDELKELCTHDEWLSIRENLIKNMGNRFDKNYYYDKENMYDELLDSVMGSNGIYDIARYGVKLGLKCPEVILKKYADEVKKMVVFAGTRSLYEDVARHLRKMQKIDGGDEVVANIMKEFREKYKNRPAMMDELSEF